MLRSIEFVNPTQTKSVFLCVVVCTRDVLDHFFCIFFFFRAMRYVASLKKSFPSFLRSSGAFVTCLSRVGTQQQSKQKPACNLTFFSLWEFTSATRDFDYRHEEKTKYARKRKERRKNIPSY